MPPALKTFFFENRTFKQTVVKNIFWLGFGNITSRGLRALLVIIAARILGVERFGVFSYALGLAGFFIVFSDIGLAAFLTREGARNKEFKLQQYISTAFSLKCSFVILGSFLIFLLGPKLARIESSIELFSLIALLFIFDSFRDFLFSITRSREKMEIEAGNNIATNVLVLILGTTALLTHPSTKILLTAYIIGTGAGFLLLLWQLRRYLMNFWRFVCFSLIRPILSEAWPLGLSSLLNVILFSTDIIMLGYFQTAEAVGIYSAPQRIVFLFHLLPGYVAVSLAPTFSRLAAKDDERLRVVLEKIVGMSFLFAFPLVLLGLLFNRDIIQLIFGASYSASAMTLGILLLTFLSAFPAGFISNALFAYNAQRYLALTLAIAAAGNIILNAILIPRFGPAGAAIATVISQSISTGINWFWLKKFNPFKTLLRLPKIVFASFGMLIASFLFSFVHAPFLLNIVLSVIFYGAVLRFFNEPLLKSFGFSRPI